MGLGKKCNILRSYAACVRKNKKNPDLHDRAGIRSFKKVGFMYNAGAGCTLGRAHYRQGVRYA